VWRNPTLPAAFALLLPIGLGVAAAVVEPADPEASVVRIVTETGVGTGTYIGNGQILTAAHVVAGDEEIVAVTADGKRATADVAYSDAGRDMAILTVDVDVPAAPYSCEAHKPGTEIEAIGWAFGRKMPVVFHTWGRIASTLVNIDGVTSIGVDITLAPGMSGGPILADGMIVGIVSGGFIDQEALGIVIPMTVICPSIPQVIS
jgi:S1-C subfamily serine protease